MAIAVSFSIRCDLLYYSYLCIINNNWRADFFRDIFVVICFIILIFAS